MKSPDFWKRGRGGWISSVLQPVAWVYRQCALVRHSSTSVKTGVPVICVGNVVAGGAGKTPVAMAIGQHLIAAGLKVHYLSRGYGGSKKGPHLVNGELDQAAEVGDEPLLLSRIAPTCVAKDRVDGAQACVDGGADVIVMDDGLQNVSLVKDISLCVIDGSYGLGNGQLIPSGPLREPLAEAIEKSNAVVLIGADDAGIEEVISQISPDLPILKAALEPVEMQTQLAGKRVHAFAGIGRPDKFFDTLNSLGCEVQHTTAFADHHAFSGDEISRLVAAAQSDKALLITTEKDYVRLDRKWSENILALPVSLVWQDDTMLTRFFEPLLSDAPDAKIK